MNGTTATPSANDETEKATAGSIVTKSLGRKRKHGDRWWRISDEKIKEAKTGDVLSMQREVYLLFYELERDVAPES